jgi:hypothetical protein
VDRRNRDAQLRSEDRDERLEAAFVLGGRRLTRSEREGLIALLADVDVHVRDIAAASLGASGEASAIGKMIENLDSMRPRFSTGTTWGLAQLVQSRKVGDPELILSALRRVQKRARGNPRLHVEELLRRVQQRLDET